MKSNKGSSLIKVVVTIAIVIAIFFFSLYAMTRMFQTQGSVKQAQAVNILAQIWNKQILYCREFCTYALNGAVITPECRGEFKELGFGMLGNEFPDSLPYTFYMTATDSSFTCVAVGEILHDTIIIDQTGQLTYISKGSSSQ